QHAKPDGRPDEKIGHRARTQQRFPSRTRGFTRRFALGVVERHVVDQSARPTDIGHDAIAGIDAQRAGDAADLRTFANVYPRGANRDALQAVDAVAEVFRVLLRLLNAPARFAAPVLVGDR